MASRNAVRRWTVVGVLTLVAAAVGVLADVAGIINFSTGRNLPDLWGRDPAAPASAGPTPTGSTPLSTPAATHTPTKAAPSPKLPAPPRLRLAVDPISWQDISTHSFTVTVRFATPGGRVDVEVRGPNGQVAYQDSYGADGQGVAVLYFPTKPPMAVGDYAVTARDATTGRTATDPEAFRVYGG